PPLLAVAADCSPIYSILDAELAPRHSHPQVPLGSDHSRHCGSFPGSPSRVSGQATWRSIVPIGLPYHLWKSPHVPRASMPAWSDAAGQDESHHAVPPKSRSTMTAYQKLVRSPLATLRASSDPIAQCSLPQ